MHAFQHVLALLFTLFAFAFAQQSPAAYDATVYITSTVYRVNTVTLSTSPTAALANQTSTFSATAAVSAVVSAAGTGVPAYPSGSNGTTPVLPSSGTPVKPSASAFTGAASSLNINVFVAAIAAGVGYMAL